MIIRLPPGLTQAMRIVCEAAEFGATQIHQPERTEEILAAVAMVRDCTKCDEDP